MSADTPSPQSRSRARIRSIEAAGERPDDCLLIDQPGAFLGKHSERLRLTVKGELVAERPLLGLEHVLILAGGVSLSADAIRACAERGVPISFISRSGAPYAKVVAPELTGTVQTRRQQLLAYLDGRGAHLTRAFAIGKLQNQAALLKYMAKYRHSLDVDLYEMAREAAFRLEHLATRVAEISGQSVDEVREEVMNTEARGARHYWEAARHLVHVPPGVEWLSRETRGAADLVNQCLNYGYGILYAHTERAVYLAGLDPYAGFLHEDRPGKPSLVLDLVEEFRPQVVDRCVFALLNQRVPLEQDATGRLDDATRTTLAQRVNERLEAEEPHAGRRWRPAHHHPVPGPPPGHLPPRRNGTLHLLDQPMVVECGATRRLTSGAGVPARRWPGSNALPELAAQHPRQQWCDGLGYRRGPTRTASRAPARAPRVLGAARRELPAATGSRPPDPATARRARPRSTRCAAVYQSDLLDDARDGRELPFVAPKTVVAAGWRLGVHPERAAVDHVDDRNVQTALSCEAIPHRAHRFGSPPGNTVRSNRGPLMSDAADLLGQLVGRGEPTAPYRYQDELAALLARGGNVVVSAPTGAGKTWAVLLPYLLARLGGDCPWDRVLYALPLRSLASSLCQSTIEGCRRAGVRLRDVESPNAHHADSHALSVMIQTGEQRLDPFLSGDLIFTTIDQLLGSYLNTPLSLPQKLSNINPGALLGSLIVLDEVHLLEPERALATALDLADRLRGYAQIVVMTATLSTLGIEQLAGSVRADIIRVDSTDVRQMPSQRDKQRTWRWSDVPLSAAAVLARHTSGRSLVLCNTVTRAQQLYRHLLLALDEAGARTTLRLLHSRFYRHDRQRVESELPAAFGPADQYPGHCADRNPTVGSEDDRGTVDSDGRAGECA